MSRLMRLLHAGLSPGGVRGRLLVFTFHRVLSRPDPLLPGEPDVADFGRMARWIAESCNVLPLAEAARHLRRGTLPARAACLTFDDGYADNLENAVPVLLQLGLPATVFVAVDAVRNGIMWNDIVLDAVRCCGVELDTAVAGIATATLPKTDPATFAARLLDALKYLPPERRWLSAIDLHRAATGTAETRRHMLTTEMVRTLVGLGFDVGGHTVSHPILSQIDDATALQEIRGCYQWLQDLTARRPCSFAYPNGRPGADYDQRHVEMVRTTGFEVAVSTRWAAGRRTSDTLQLPRFAPWERSKAAFFGRMLRTCVVD